MQPKSISGFTSQIIIQNNFFQLTCLGLLLFYCVQPSQFDLIRDGQAQNEANIIIQYPTFFGFGASGVVFCGTGGIFLEFCSLLIMLLSHQLSPEGHFSTLVNSGVTLICAHLPVQPTPPSVPNV